jgi:SAM-dependent methyltransferase
MAKIVNTRSADEHGPGSTESLEVRVWGLAGRSNQFFSVDKGGNFDASGNFWLEIIYAVQGVHLFYTRNFLHYYGFDGASEAVLKCLEDFSRSEKEESTFGFGDMLPETAIYLRRKRFKNSMNSEEDGPMISSYDLEVSVDMGVIFGDTSPGMHETVLRMKYIDEEDGMAFMRDLTAEITAAHAGKHPDPALLPPGSSNWTFVTQLNRMAYDKLVDSYQESYFNNPLFSELFDQWLGQTPIGERILDAGCGHGDPVIARMLERGYQVVGTDISPAMLTRAQAQFPQAVFYNHPITEFDQEIGFSAACSLSSLLYQDPIDLSHSLFHLHGLLQEGSLLLLYAYDLHPDWCGIPYGTELNQMMWSWSYSLEDAVRILEEHGRYKVLQAQNVTTPEEKEKQIAIWRDYTQKDYEKAVKELSSPTYTPAPPDLSTPPENLPHPYLIIARRI